MPSDNIINPHFNAPKDFPLNEDFNQTLPLQALEKTPKTYSNVNFDIAAHPLISNAEYRIYSIIASFCGGRGVFFVSQETLQQKIPWLSGRNFRKICQSLEKKGFLYRNQISKHRRGSTRFLVVKCHWKKYLSYLKKQRFNKEASRIEFFFTPRAAERNVPVQLRRNVTDRANGLEETVDAKESDASLTCSVCPKPADLPGPLGPVSHTHQRSGIHSSQNPKVVKLVPPVPDPLEERNGCEDSSSHEDASFSFEIEERKPTGLVSISPSLESKSDSRESLWYDFSKPRKSPAQDNNHSSAKVAAAPTEGTQDPTILTEVKLMEELKASGVSEANRRLGLIYFRMTQKIIMSKDNPIAYIISAIKEGWAAEYVTRHKKEEEKESRAQDFENRNREEAAWFSKANTDKFDRWSVKSSNYCIFFFFKLGKNTGGYPIGFKDKDFQRRFSLAKKEAEYLDSASEQELAEIERLAPTVTQIKPRSKNVHA